MTFSNIPEMAYVEGSPVPWHGQGTVLPVADPNGWLDLKNNPLNFAVEKRNVLIEGTDQIFDGKAVLFRPDRQAPISIVGADYGLTGGDGDRPYVARFQIPEEIHDLLEPETCGFFGAGNRAWYSLKMKGMESHIPGDDSPVINYLTLFSSLDGSAKTCPAFTRTRVVCSNTWAHAWADMTAADRAVGVRHRSEVTVAIGLDSMRAYLTQAVQAKSGFERTAAVLAKRQITVDEWSDLLDLVMPSKEGKGRNGGGVSSRTENQRARLSEIYETGEYNLFSGPIRTSAWGAFSAITAYMTHEKATRVSSEVPDNMKDRVSASQRWAAAVTPDETSMTAKAWVHLVELAQAA